MLLNVTHLKQYKYLKKQNKKYVNNKPGPAAVASISIIPNFLYCKFKNLLLLLKHSLVIIIAFGSITLILNGLP